MAFPWKLPGGIWLLWKKPVFLFVSTAFLAGVYVQKAFISPTVLSLKAGITSRFEKPISLLRPMICQSNRVYVLADSSKFQQEARYQIAPMRKDFVYITDTELPDAVKEMCADNRLYVIYAEE